MQAEFIVFLAVALVAIGAAIGMALSRHALYAAMFLVLNFACVAVMYLLLNAPFLAVAQVTVYTGAIMVLFVFVIMLLGAEKLPAQETRPEMRWQRPLAIGLGAFLLLQVGLALALPGMRAAPEPIDASPLAIGMKLFTTYLFPFEVASVLLLAAMVGAVTLTRKD
ncbi:MAG: NADH-quinone oxidoreductase subunit J [Thermoflexales bacterium]|nr:NADH-quinone oxidoreductase subunit J [Thermoflexales bacterium]